MSKLFDWLEQAELLFKASKPKVITDSDLAELESLHGKWDSIHGSRADALVHLRKIGFLAARRSLPTSTPGTPEHSAGKLAVELRSRDSRKRSDPKVRRLFDDSLTEPLDDRHFKHYAERYRQSFSVMEYTQRSKGLGGDEYHPVRVMPNHESIPVQFRSQRVDKRIKHMRSSGAEPFHSMEDMTTVARAVDHAHSIGTITTPEHNRFRVMHEAIRLQSKLHEPGGEFSVLPFKPSWASHDISSLRTIERSSEALHHNDRERISRSVSAAIEAHQKFPNASRQVRMNGIRIQALKPEYPAIHSLDEPVKERKAPVSRPLVRAARKEVQADISHGDVQHYRDNPTSHGFDPIKVKRIEAHLAEERRKRKLEKAFNTATLSRSYRKWRNK